METLQRQKALDLFESISGALESLVAALRDACCGVIVHQLPLVEDDDSVSTHIPVSRVGGIHTVDTEALDLACDSLTQFLRMSKQKCTTTYRLPGIIVVDRDVTNQVAQVNWIKDDLQRHLIQCYPDTIARSRLCNRLFPGIHMNHVYRHIFCVPENIRRLTFTWQCQTPADVWITPAEAIQMTNKAIEEETKLGMSPDVHSRLKSLEIARRYFKRLPTPRVLSEDELDAHPERIHFQLVHRKYVRPHPRVQMFDPEHGPRPLHTHAANLPLLAKTSDPVLDVRTLSDYQAGRSRKRSDRKQGFREISHLLHILGGYPSVDHYRRRLLLNQKAGERAKQRKASLRGDSAGIGNYRTLSSSKRV